MKRGLRIGLVLFVFALIFMGVGLASHNFSAKAEIVSSGTCGEAGGNNLTWTLDDQGVLTISGTGNMADFDTSSSPAPWGNGITQVAIQDGITSIGSFAFSSCHNLTSLSLPDSVTSLHYCAFNACFNLEAISIPNTVEYIDYLAINCDAIVYADLNSNLARLLSKASCYFRIPGANYSLRYRFDSNGLVYGDTIIDTEIARVDRSVYDFTIPSIVTIIGDNAFSYCTTLTDVTIPDCITSIGAYAFQRCTSLTSVTIPASVTDIAYGAFAECGNLRITILNGNTNLWSKNGYYDASISTDAVIYTPCAASPTAVVQYAGNNGIKCKFIHDYDNDVCVRCGIEEGIVDSGNCGANGDNLTWTLDDEGVLTISGTGEMAKYSYYSPGPWGTGVTQAIIENGVTSIGDFAFLWCSNLTSVSIPDSVTSIGRQAFAYCSKLTSIAIPDSVTSIGHSAFFYCSNLSSVTIPDSVTSIGLHAFDGCSSLTSVTIPDSVTSISDYAFRSCSGLASVTIPDGVTSIGNSAFSGCSSLTSVTIPDSVTSIGEDPFAGCSQLTEFVVSNTNTRFGVLDGVLYDKSMTVLVLYPGGKPETTFAIPNSVTQIEAYAFSGCGNLTSVTIPNSVTSIGECAFSGFSNLTSVTIPDSVTSIGDRAFEDCYNLIGVTIPDSVTSIGNNAFEYCNNLTSVTIPDSVTSIGNSAFSCCDSLTSVTIPESVTRIGNSTFYCCPLTRIAIPESITSIGNAAFEQCMCLTSVTIPASVESIGYNAFLDCTSLASVTILNPNAVIGDDSYDVFFDCAENLTLYGWTNSTTQTYADNAGIPFYALPDSELVSGSCGDNVTWTLIPATGVLTISGTGQMEAYNDVCAPWGTGIKQVIIQSAVTSIGDYAFYGCSDLMSVTIQDGVTSIGERAFCGCDGLESVTIPDSVTSIGCEVFYGCSGLTSVMISEGVTSIRNRAFEDCEGITCMTIPASVDRIEYLAFYGCANLSGVTILNPSAVIGDDDYDVFEDCASGLTLYGWAGSTAQTYAANAGLAFEPIAAVDFVLPAGLTAIEADAFQGISAVAVQIPSGVTRIEGNPFSGSDVQYIFGTSGTAAQTFAVEYGYTFVPVAE